MASKIRDFMHVEDVASAFVSLLGSECTSAVNIASGQGIKLKRDQPSDCSKNWRTGFDSPRCTQSTRTRSPAARGQYPAFIQRSWMAAKVQFRDRNASNNSLVEPATMSRYVGAFFLMLMSLFSCDCAMDGPEFKNWWNEYKKSHFLPSDLVSMEEYFVQSGLIDQSSKFWNILNQKNVQQIATYGYENFKQTVTRNYFTWVVDLQHPYIANLFKNRPLDLTSVSQEELNKKHALFSPEQSVNYNTITLLMLNYVLANGGQAFLDQLDEPLLGNPPSIAFNGRQVSQDILNSLLEFMSIYNSCDTKQLSSVIEVGAGSGRTSYVFMKLLPHLKYIIVDIPPALFLSQTYLSSVFQDRKIFKFRSFNTFAEVADEFSQADLIFLMPDQLKKIPDQSVDLFLAIDCLHEMKQDVVQFYFEEADRLASSFYFKCWQKTIMPYDGLSYVFENYPINPSWQRVFYEGCVVPSDFFHAFYKIR